MPHSISSRLSALTGNRTLRRVVVGTVAAVLLYDAFGFFVLPGIVRSQTEKLVAEKLHRQTTVGTVAFNPFTLALTLRDVKLHEPNSERVFMSFDTLYVDLSSMSMLRLAPVIRELRLVAPYVHLERTAANRYNVDDIVELISNQPPSPEPARFSINNIRLEGGRVEFDDRPVKAVHAVTDIELGIPFISSLPSQVDIFVEPMLSAKVDGSPFEFKGKARPFAKPADAVVDLQLDGLDLTRYLDYLPVKPRARISGAKLDLKMSAHFQQGAEQPALLLEGDASLKSLKVADLDGKPVLSLRELGVHLHEADVFRGRVDLSRISVDGLQADVVRGEDGQMNITRLMPATAPANSTAKPATKSSALHLTLGELAVRKAALRYVDDRAAQRASLDKLDITVRKLAVDTRQRTVSIGEIASNNADLLFSRGAQQASKPASTIAEQTAPTESGTQEAYSFSVAKTAITNWTLRAEDRAAPKPIVTTATPVALTVESLSNAPASKARIDLKAGFNNSGRMAVHGSVGFAPLHADLALDLKNVDILPLQPFVADMVNLRATSATLSSSGHLQLDTGRDGKLVGGFKGDATLGNLQTVDNVDGNDFLRWKSLHAAGMDVRFAPLGVTVDQLALDDFFARIIIDPSGRINLQDIVRSDAGKTTVAAQSAQAGKGSGSASVPPIVIKRVNLQNGRVRFTDNFIKPNYSASLSRFGGAVSGLSSDPASRADVDLHGEVNGAPLTVGGRINPLRGDLFLDIKANARGMELAPLSAYSGKYVGYGIEKGKLSFEAGYKIDNRKLVAENRLVLEQLTFGDKIDSPKATSLPVKFAVALLADRNGVIDVNLPISGSLDDPQFSIGAIVFKAIGNLIAKAVTQPFAMLGHLFGGGGEEMSSMDFEPGRATISPAGEEKLHAMAKMLADRPGLKLDIGGRADADADREGLKRVSVERKVRMLKLRDLRAKNADADPGSVVVSREEYPGLLLRAYRDEKFPKPRNVLGLPKSLSVNEMEKLMMDNADIDEDDLIALCNQRAQAVKNWLQKNGQVSPERMYIVAAKVANKDGRTSPSRVDFTLGS